MARFGNFYVYCARHGEYQPEDQFIADSWYASYDPEELQPRPVWVTDEIVADGFDETDPSGSLYIKLAATDQAGLLAAIENQAEFLRQDEPSGDDTIYDYFPSGCLLLQAMIADLKEPACIARGKAIWLQVMDYIHGLDVADEILENVNE